MTKKSLELPKIIQKPRVTPQHKMIHLRILLSVLSRVETERKRRMKSAKRAIQVTTQKVKESINADLQSYFELGEKCRPQAKYAQRYQSTETSKLL